MQTGWSLLHNKNCRNIRDRMKVVSEKKTLQKTEDPLENEDPLANRTIKKLLVPMSWMGGFLLTKTLRPKPEN